MTRRTSRNPERNDAAGDVWVRDDETRTVQRIVDHGAGNVMLEFDEPVRELDRAYYGRSPQDMKRLGWRKTGPVRPNRAAMNTKFGKNIDPDRVEGARGRDLDRSFDRYETFHKKQPIRVVELRHELPTQLVHVGDALAVMYRTDKWKKDGDDEDYKHLHDRDENKPYEPGHGVKAYVPKRLVPSGVGGRPCGPPVRYPASLTLLGKSLGFFVRLPDGEVYEIDRLKHSYLYCSPSGNMLAVYAAEPEPNQNGAQGFLCVMAGGKLRVIADGIDG